MTRKLFTVRAEAHRKLRCATCGSLMSEGDTAVALTGNGWSHMLHVGPCPTREPYSPDPSKRVIQGS